MLLLLHAISTWVFIISCIYTQVVYVYHNNFGFPDNILAVKIVYRCHIATILNKMAKPV